MKRFLGTLAFVVFCAGAAYFLWKYFGDDSIKIQPPIAGVSAIKMKVEVFHPPLQFKGATQAGGGTPPDWLQHQVPIFSGKVPQEKYPDYFSKEYIDAYGKYFKKDPTPIPVQTFFYGINFSVGNSDYMIATSSLSLDSAIPKNKAAILADLYKKVGGKWLAYPPKLVPICPIYPGKIWMS